MNLRARVHNGRLVLDEPTSLPEGTEVELTFADGGDDLAEEERVALDAALSRAWERMRAGQSKPASGLLRKLRKRR